MNNSASVISAFPNCWCCWQLFSCHRVSTIAHFLCSCNRMTIKYKYLSFNTQIEYLLIIISALHSFVSRERTRILGEMIKWTHFWVSFYHHRCPDTSYFHYCCCSSFISHEISSKLYICHQLNSVKSLRQLGLWPFSAYSTSLTWCCCHSPQINPSVFSP